MFVDSHTCTQRDHKAQLVEPKSQVYVRTKSHKQYVKLSGVNIDLESEAGRPGKERNVGVKQLECRVFE